jgi:hypothetical protein
MKVFYTERDIEDLHALGISRLEVNDNVVLTDLAREKAEKLGILLAASTQPPDVVPALPTAAPAKSLPNTSDLVAQIKAGVIAKLGTDQYNGLLDQIIPQILARINSPTGGEKTDASSSPDKY